MDLITSAQDKVADGVNDSWVTPVCCPVAAGSWEVSVLLLAHICIAGLRLARKSCPNWVLGVMFFLLIPTKFFLSSETFPYSVIEWEQDSRCCFQNTIFFFWPNCFQIKTTSKTDENGFFFSFLFSLSVHFGLSHSCHKPAILVIPCAAPILQISLPTVGKEL